MDISMVSIFLGLALLMFLAYRGHSIIWVAPVCAAFAALLSGMNTEFQEGKTLADYVLDTYLNDYMKGLAKYVTDWFPAFFLGAVYGKVMDMTGSARSLANRLVDWIGAKRAVAAVVIPCLLMTYGGISLFVVVFVIYPMGYAIYRAANLPRTLLPGAIAFGAFGITMTAVPGTPQIQNMIPRNFYGTDAMAAPLMSIVAIILIGGPGYLYLEWRARQARARGQGFVEDAKFVEVTQSKVKLPSWHWLSGLLPIITVVVLLNYFKQDIVVSLLGGIALCCVMNLQQAKTLLPAISAGAEGSLTAIMNTSCAVGFGSVVRVMPGFAKLTSMMMNMPGSILFSEAVAVNVLAGATGSASGGMSIALTALAPQYLEKAAAIGLSPEYLHRIASLSSGGLDTLPHNGAVLTLLAVSHCTHKESYWDVCVTTCIIPFAGSLVLALGWGLFL
ncbi:MAG: GntP family permease [Synergistaceae bacterium]|jgi:H+/gluconate symporter-like permease|nr:GntP family permease [Synergistaceae bacterium]